MGQRLGPLDLNFWTIHSATTPQVIASYFPLDRPLDPVAVRQAFTEQLDDFRRFRQRVVRRLLLRWEDDPRFDLEYHVRHIEVPEATTPEGLAHAVDTRFSLPLDLSHSPWEVTIFRGGGDVPPAGLLFRAHHALTDGLGGLEFFHRVCHTERRSARSGERHSAGTAASKTAKTPPRFAMDFWQSVRRLLSETSERGFRSALNGQNSAERQLTFIELPLDELRHLRRRAGGSLNDVLLSFVAGTVAKYQQMREMPLEPMKILIPFNLRRRKDDSVLGNHLTGVGVNLPIAHPDPIERLHLIRDSINRMKVDGSIGAFRLLGVLIAWLPSSLRRQITDAASRRTNFICTNMPGPEQPLYLCGSKLLSNFGCAALLKEHGVSFSFISYAGKMCVSIVSDPAIVPDPRQLVRYFLDSVRELQEAAA